MTWRRDSRPKGPETSRCCPAPLTQKGLTFGSNTWKRREERSIQVPGYRDTKLVFAVKEHRKQMHQEGVKHT